MERPGHWNERILLPPAQTPEEENLQSQKQANDPPPLQHNPPLTEAEAELKFPQNQWLSKCGAWISSISATWALAGGADPPVLLDPRSPKLWGWGPVICVVLCFNKPFSDSGTHSSLSPY